MSFMNGGAKHGFTREPIVDGEFAEVAVKGLPAPVKALPAPKRERKNK